MGLLSQSLDDDRLMVQTIVEGVAQYWDSHLRDWSGGFTPRFTTSGVDRICRFATKHIFNNEFFPEPPGPFKRAAALSILIRHFECVSFVKDNGAELKPGGASSDMLADFKAKFAFYCITPCLRYCRLDGSDANLRKLWVPATLHLRSEMLLWLKWLEMPTLDRSHLIDIPRICRAIMALAMIIEQSYYIVGSTIDCDVWRRPCGPNSQPDRETRLLSPDLYGGFETSWLDELSDSR